MKLCYNTSFALPKQPKYLDLSYKMDLDLWDCFGRKKTLSYIRRNMVFTLQGKSYAGKQIIVESDSKLI